ncbi:glutathione S-transferase 1, isoform C [Trichonephila clavipes]|nr:glutathione S-transferase 1, isoform C [Trichonephila clavipes]
MVWAGIMINGRTRLHVIANGTMTGQRYIDEVLLPHVRLFRGAVGDKFVFLDDNATCHRTLAVQDCLDSEGIQRLVWPARSPDLNPIEMCGMLCFWQPVLWEINDAENYLQTDGLNVHLLYPRALQTVLEAKQDEFGDDVLIYTKGLCEELEISFEPQDKSGGNICIFGDGSKDVQISYEDDLKRTMFFSRQSNW